MGFACRAARVLCVGLLLTMPGCFSIDQGPSDGSPPASAAPGKGSPPATTSLDARIRTLESSGDVMDQFELAILKAIRKG